MKYSYEQISRKQTAKNEFEKYINRTEQVNDKSWQKRLLHIIHSRNMLIMVIILIILDLLLVISGIILEIQFQHSQVDELWEHLEKCRQDENINSCDPKGPKLKVESGHLYLKNIEHQLGKCSLVILALFIIENMLLLIAEGSQYFSIKYWFHWLDFAIVVISFVLEIIYMNHPEGGLLIIARLWRLIRIGASVFEADEIKKEIEEEDEKTHTNSTH